MDTETVVVMVITKVLLILNVLRKHIKIMKVAKFLVSCLLIKYQVISTFLLMLLVIIFLVSSLMLISTLSIYPTLSIIYHLVMKAISLVLRKLSSKVFYNPLMVPRRLKQKILELLVLPINTILALFPQPIQIYPIVNIMSINSLPTPMK